VKRGVKEIFSGCKQHFLQVATTYLRTVKKAHFNQSHAWAPLNCIFCTFISLYFVNIISIYFLIVLDKCCLACQEFLQFVSYRNQLYCTILLASIPVVLNFYSLTGVSDYA